MKVLHVFNELRYSGAEIMYAAAAPIFQREGIEMIALSTGENLGDFASQFELVNVKIYHRPILNNTFNPIVLFKYFKGILDLSRAEQVDVVHIHRSTYYWYFSLIAFIQGVKSFRTVHNVFKNRKITWLKAVIERYTAKKLWGLTFQSIGKSVYQNELHYYKNSSILINNWFDSTKFYPAENDNERKKIREELCIPLNDFIIISTGSCSHIKNHSDIIKALGIVLSQISCTYLHLGHGELEVEEKELALSLGLSNKIKFLGNQNNVRKFLIASDAFIMTSKFEGLSIASIEAMACKLPSILYNSPGLRDLIEKDNNGFLINSDSQILAEKIIFLHENAAIGLDKANNACKYANDNFSIEVCVKKIIDLYQN